MKFTVVIIKIPRPFSSNKTMLKELTKDVVGSKSGETENGRMKMKGVSTIFPCPNSVVKWQSWHGGFFDNCHRQFIKECP